MDISIIVPIYKGKKYIPDIIDMVESNISQCKNQYSMELILVNDDPMEQIDDIDNSDIKIQVLQTSVNRGIHGARVYGLSKAVGEYILFLDQDDVIRDKFISSQVAKIQGSDAIVCEATEGGNKFYNENRRLEDVVSLPYMLTKGNHIISPGQVLLKKDAIPSSWIENKLSVNGADDYFLWICMLSQGKILSINKDVLFEHVLSDSNQSMDLVAMSKSENNMLEIIKNQHLLSEENFDSLRTCIENIHISRMSYLQNLRRKTELINFLNKIDKHQIGTFFSINEKKILIYGAGEVGISLANRCALEGIEVIGFIDRVDKELINNIPVYKIDQVPKGAEAIVISLVDNYKELRESLSATFHLPIYAIEEIMQLR